MAKQTGRGCGVKGARHKELALVAAVGALLALLSGCASTWHNAGKTQQEANADEKMCSAEAEETALVRTANQKVDYERLHQTSPIPGTGRGETPMQLADRGRTEDVYSREFESCMRSKGYTQGNK